jgi:hypothetical protein
MDFDPLEQKEMQLEMITVLRAVGYVTTAMNLGCCTADSSHVVGNTNTVSGH